jgi:hypothetical protein
MELPKKDEWVEIRDVLFGFGFRKWDKDGIDGASDKVVWHNDVERLLGIDIWKVREQNFDSIYEKIHPIIQAEREERRKNFISKEYKKISIPQVNRTYPEL